MRKILMLALFLTAAAAAAQTVELGHWVQGVAPLDQGWKTHAGDNPAWVAPTFDDSSWQRISRLDAPANVWLATPGFRWYRIHLHLQDVSQPLALGLLSPKGSTDVWINGHHVDWLVRRPAWASISLYPQVVSLPQGIPDLTIAVRTDYIAYQAAVTQRPCFSDARIGSPSLVVAWSETNLNARRLPFLSLFLVDLGSVLAGLGMLLLYRLDRAEAGFLWLGFYLIAQGLVEIAFGLAFFGIGPTLANGAIGDPCQFLVLVLLVEFVFRFVRRRKALFWRLFQSASLAMVPIALAINLSGRGEETYVLVSALWTIPIILLLPAELIRWFHQGNREAGLLVLPIGLNALFGLLFVGGFFAFNYLHLPAFEWTISPVTIAGFPFLLQSCGDVLFLLSIGAVMLLRFQRVSRAQARASAEFEAARIMQRRLVPEALPPVPSCNIGVCYLPANEVGGDFYQVLPLPDGSHLFVLGDVSGKGLRAAMTATLVIGALRALASCGLGPADLLAALNQQLLEARSEGFVTCLCIRFEPGGTCWVANAGHLSPYHNGDEVSIENGLPLGIAADATYSEITIQLAPGDQLTFLSDGVVEAQSPTGELYGFDRTAAISTQSAEEIAHAAQTFGQEDDITVLTVTRQALDLEPPAGAGTLAAKLA